MAGDLMPHLSRTDALTALGALALAAVAKVVGVDGEFFALAAAVVGFSLGMGMSKGA